MGKIADAWVEVGANDGKFSKSINRLASVMEPLTSNAKAFAAAADVMADRTGGVFSSVVGGAADAVRAVLAVSTAIKVYSYVSKAASIINPFGGIKENAIRIATAALGLFATKIGVSVSGLVAFAAAATVAVAAMGAIASGVAKASALAEQSDFSKIVLGRENFDQAAAAASRLSWSYGVLRKETLATATTAASMAKNMGLSQKQAATLGMEVARLATDLSSAANTSIQDAATAINAVFRGESDPIERYGVSIRESAIEAEALASGLARSKNEIDESVKFQARWNLLIKQTRDAQGNLTDTAGSYANVMRNVRGQLAEASTTLGEAFLPLAGNFARVMLAASYSVRAVAAGFKFLFTPISMVSDALNGVYDRLQRITGMNKEGFTLFKATAAENELKRIKRFEAELAAEREQKAQQEADMKLKAEKGLLTDADKKAMADAEAEAQAKKAEAAQKEADAIRDAHAERRRMDEEQLAAEDKKIKAQEEYEKAVQESLDTEKKRIKELEDEAVLQRERKLEDMELDRQRRQEDRNAAFMFAGLGEARDKMFTAAMDARREDGRKLQDFGIEDARRQEDMRARQDEIRRTEEEKRAQLQKENNLTQSGLQSEVDRIVQALRELRTMWGVS